MGGLYIIWLSDQHFYGGRTSDFRIRWDAHLNALRAGRHHNERMQRVFQKYGRFDPVVLEEIDEDLLAAEQRWLDENFEKPGCLNLSRWADRGANRGRKLTAEHRQKISEAHKGKVMSEESRKKMSAAFRKRKASPETKRRMSESQIGRKHTEESKRKMSEIAKKRGGLGPKVASEESKRKVSESLKRAYAEGRRKSPFRSASND